MPDISENKKAQKTSILSQEYIRNIIDSSPDMIIAVDTNRKITEFNRAAEVTFGYKKEEVIGKSVNILYADLAVSAEVHQSILINGKSVREILNKRKNGEVFPAFLSSTPLRDMQGNLIGFMGISRDITEQKRIEAAEREQRVLAEALRDTAESLNSTLDPKEVLEHVLTNVGFVVPHDTADIMLVENGNARVVQCHGYDKLGLEEEFLNWQGPIAEIPTFREMITTRQPLVISNISDYPDWVDILPRWQQGFLGVPICYQNEILGFLNLNSLTPGFFNAEHAQRLQVFANQVAIAIVNSRSFEATRQYAARSEALAHSAERLNKQLDLETVLFAVCEEAQYALNVPAACIYLYDEEKDLFNLAANLGLPSEFSLHFKPFSRNFYDEIVNRFGLVASIPDIQAVHDLPNTDLFVRYNIRTAGGAGLLREGQLVGLLLIFTIDHVRRFSEDELALLKGLANQAAQAIANARLFEQEQTHLDELSGLYDLSRSLVGMDDFDAILELISQRANTITNVTFSRLLLLEGDSLVVRMANPIRMVDFDLQVGRREPLAAYSYCQNALKQGTPVVLRSDNPDVCSAERNYLLMDFIQSLCLIPLKAGDHILGLLQLGERRNKAREPFHQGKIQLALNIADQAASALHRANLHQRIVQQLGQLDTLYQMGIVISSNVDHSFTLRELVRHIENQLDVDAIAIRVYDSTTHLLQYSTGLGFRTDMMAGLRLHPGEGYLGRAAFEGHIFTTSNLEKVDDPIISKLSVLEDLVSYCGVPLIAKEGIKGVLDIFHRRCFVHDLEWLHLMELMAQMVALAIETSQLFESLQKTNMELTSAYDATIEGWSRALDLRDKETEGHSQRVAEMSVEMGRAIGLNEEAVMHLRRGALLHDIGKMGIPDHILLKPEPLSEEEWEVMRRHPEYAYQLLSTISFLHPALDIPYCHHEKWDGTGYPQGLRGKEIPLAARIFTIADVWDALTSDRPYRDAWSEEKALGYIQEQSGKHFDPKVVEVFLQLTAKRKKNKRLLTDSKEVKGSAASGKIQPCRISNT